MASSRKLLEDIKANNYKNYPVENALLADETDYIRNNYYKFLALVLQQGEEVSEGQKSMFSRLLVGTDAERNVVEYLRQALDVKIEEYIEFMDQLSDKTLRYRFLLDAILIGCCDSRAEDDVLELIAAFMESLKINIEEAGDICFMARSILEQDSHLYWNTMQESNLSCIQDISGEYTEAYVQDSIYCYEKIIEIYYSENTVIDFKRLLADRCEISDIDEKCTILVAPGFQAEGGIEIKSPYNLFVGWDKILIHNATIVLADRGISFQNCKNIVFSKCKFVAGRYEIAAEHSEKIKFVDCVFNNFEARVMHIESIKDLSVVSTSFEDCCYKEEKYISNWDEIGGIIYTHDRERCGMTLIKECTFVDCRIHNIQSCYSSAIVANCKCQVMDCSFERCWGYYRDYLGAMKLFPKDENRTLFIKGTIGSNNTLKNCANFA